MTTRALLALLLCVSSCFAGPNLLTDPSFEGSNPPNGNPSTLGVWFAPFEPVAFAGTYGAVTGAKAAILESTDTAVGMVAQTFIPGSSATYRIGVRAKLAPGSTGSFTIYPAQGTAGAASMLVAYQSGVVEIQSPPGTVVSSTSGHDFSTFQLLYLTVVSSSTEPIDVALLKEISTTGAWVLDDAFAQEAP